MLFWTPAAAGGPAALPGGEKKVARVLSRCGLEILWSADESSALPQRLNNRQRLQTTAISHPPDPLPLIFYQPGIEKPVSTLLRPAQVKNPCHFLIAQPPQLPPAFLISYSAAFILLPKITKGKDPRYNHLPEEAEAIVQEGSPGAKTGDTDVPTGCKLAQNPSSDGASGEPDAETGEPFCESDEGFRQTGEGSWPSDKGFGQSGEGFSQSGGGFCPNGEGFCESGERFCPTDEPFAPSGERFSESDEPFWPTDEPFSGITEPRP